MSKRKQSVIQLSGLYGILPFENPVWKELEHRDPSIRKYRNLTIKAISSKNSVAWKSYFHLLEAGFTPPEMLEWLVGAAVLLPQRGKAPNWLTGLGMTQKQIEYLPKRLRNLADEIERLNKYPFLRPDVWVSSIPVSEEFSKAVIDGLSKRLMSLPGLLRIYAAFVARNSRFFSGYFRSLRGPRPRTQILGALISLVRKQTGQPRYTNLSNILMETAQVAKRSERGLDANSLKTLDAKQKIAPRT